MSLVIHSAFCGGNIEVESADDPADIRLRLRPDPAPLPAPGAAPSTGDPAPGPMQWFSFRLSGAAGRECRLRIVNAGQAAFPKGWEDYQVCASDDGETWFRVPTQFVEGELHFQHTPRNLAWFAYHVPYPLERLWARVARWQASPRVRVHTLGATPDGHPLELLQVGTPAPGKRVLWLLGRQHAGETQGAWWMEGALDLLTHPHDPLALALLEQAVVYALPICNPDGSRRGHLRLNALGADLNRSWALEDAVLRSRAPEVALIRGAMIRTGADFCLDVHGDEGLPYCFMVGHEGIPSLTDERLALLNGYRAALAARCPDFQTEHGYGRAPAGKANLALCTNYVAETFGALAFTLEQPFKDAANHPDPVRGWTPVRSKALARDCLATVLEHLPRLNASGAQAAQAVLLPPPPEGAR